MTKRGMIVGMLVVTMIAAMACGQEERYTGFGLTTPDGGSPIVTATCNDRVQNGSETGVDCGGSCGTTCSVGNSCLTNDECASGVCSNGSCAAAASCMDNVKNGNEGDIDCGAICNNLCADFRTCKQDADCASGVCNADVCQPPRCQDGVKNGQEIDVDCGGTACATRCQDGQMCQANSDCATDFCHQNRCRSQAATTSSFSVTSNVPVNPTVHFYTSAREITQVTPGSVTFNRDEVCNSQFSVNGTSKRGIKVNAEVNGQWWDCNNSEYHKLDNLVFSYDNLAIPKNRLELFNGQTCGSTASDVFIPAEVVGVYCP